MCVNGDL